MSHVRALASFAVACRTGALPPAVRADVPARVLDILGLCLAARDADGPAVVRRTVSRWPGAPYAALVGGTLAHALDFDDTHLPSVLHPSASVVPAALAVASTVDAPGSLLMSAVAAGVEITNRLGLAAYDPALANSVFFERGLHATSICGTIGSAAAAALLLGLDSDGVASAMGVAASMGAGLLEANRAGGTVKQIHCGWAAHAGVTAAHLAADGLTAPDSVLEGRFGFYAAYTDATYDADALVGALGTRWELLRTAYKPYPSNHFTHPGIDCALALRASGLDPSAVDWLELGVAAPTLRTIAEPAAEKAHPRSTYHAKFSGPYTIATALLGGGGLGVGLDDFTGPLDPARLALAAKVRCVADDRATSLFPHAFAAVLRAGVGERVYEHRVDASRGSADAPLTPADLDLKFRLNAARVLSPTEADTLAATVRNLEHLPSVAPLTAGPPSAGWPGQR